MLCERLLDLQAAGGAARGKVARRRFVKDEWIPHIQRSQAVLVKKRSGRDLAAGVEHSDYLARILIERVNVQRNPIIEQSEPSANHRAGAGEDVPGNSHARRHAKALRN